MEKRPGESRTEQVYIIRSQHINASHRLFGGFLMQWIDEVAGVVCRRHSGGDVTAATIDNLQFKEGAFENDMVVIVGTITFTGSSSMEVKVDSFVEDYDGSRKLINRAYIVMVSIGADGRPKRVPQLIPETDEEKAEWEAGKERYLARKQRRG